MVDLTGAIWRKSTRSGNGGNCVEVADNLHARQVVGVRDSKNPHGPALTVHPACWTAFTHSIVTNDLRSTPSC